MTRPIPVAILLALQAEPSRFTFDAAMRVLRHAAGQGTVSRVCRLRATSALSYPASDILTIDATGPALRVNLGVPGLAGAGGVLPRHYSGVLAGRQGARLAALLDVLSDRMLSGLAEAGIKYRLDRAVEQARLAARDTPSMPETALLALAGFANQTMVRQLPEGGRAVLHYAGLFAQRPRSADRLAAIASDWLGQKVAVREFAGAWLAIDRAQQTCLPRGGFGGQHFRLGADATAGARVWDPQARITLRIGPLEQQAFESLLPGRPETHRFVALVRAYLGVSTAFRINLVLRPEDVVSARLAGGQTEAAHLGWNSWLHMAPGQVRLNTDEVAFSA